MQKKLWRSIEKTLDLDRRYYSTVTDISVNKGIEKLHLLNILSK